MYRAQKRLAYLFNNYAHLEIESLISGTQFSS